MVKHAALGLVVLVIGLGMTACGDDDNGTDTTTTEETTTTETTTEETTETTSAVGKEVFVANCGSCHTLSDAGTSGTVGPNLDEIDLSADDIANQVRNGGGGMPPFADQLSDEEIQEVAAYVEAARGGG